MNLIFKGALVFSLYMLAYTANAAPTVTQSNSTPSCSTPAGGGDIRWTNAGVPVLRDNSNPTPTMFTEEGVGITLTYIDQTTQRGNLPLIDYTGQNVGGDAGVMSLWQRGTNEGNYFQVILDFDQPVTGLTPTSSDLDFVNNRFRDVMIFQGSLGGIPVEPDEVIHGNRSQVAIAPSTAVAPSACNIPPATPGQPGNDAGIQASDTAPCFYGIANNAPNTLPNANGRAVYNNPVDRLVVTYVAGDNNDGDDADFPSNGQFASFGDLCWAEIIDPMPDMSITKSVTSGDPFANAGDTIDYQYSVTNTGNVQITNVSVSDDKIVAPNSVSCAPTTIAPTEVSTCTATYTVTQADVLAGEVTNTAGPVGTPPPGTTLPPLPTASVTVPLDPQPEMTIAKSATSGDPFSQAGDTISYQYIVTNSGNVALTSVTVSDDKITAPNTVSCPTTALAVAASTTCTAGYTVTQADVLAGEVTNSATTDGTPPAGAPPVPPVTPSSVTVPIDPQPSMTIAKETTAGNPFTQAGDVIQYLYTVTNTGNVQIDSLAIQDDKIPAGDITCATTTLAPQAVTTCTASYTVSAADQAALQVTNTAIPTGNPPAGSPPLPPVPPAMVIVPIDPQPSMSIAKSSTTIDFASAGDLISYEYVVTNTGNVALTDVAVTDDKITAPNSVSCPATTLTPNVSTTCTASYTVTQADIEAGEVVNNATASGTPPPGSPPVPAVPPSSVTVPLDPLPSMTIDKNVVSGNPFSAAGDEINYSYLVTNTGNVTITSLAVDDDKISAPNTVSCPVTQLAPLASTTCTAVYTVTQDDVDAGEVTNLASPTGIPDSGTLPPPTPDTVTVPSNATPSMTIDKSIVSGDPFNADSDTINYSFVVTNTGPTTLSNVVVADSLTGAPAGEVLSNDVAPTGDSSDAAVNGSWDSLAPGDSVTFTASYTVEQGDVDAGSVLNTANGAADGGVTSPDDNATANAVRTPELSIVKDEAAGSPNPFVAGDTLLYEYAVTNTGNVTITDITVADDKVDLTGSVTCPSPAADSLAPGVTVTCTGSYTATQADIDSGGVTNVATPNGTPPVGTSLPPPTPDTVTVPADQAPALTIDKSADDTSDVIVGQTLTYTYVVTNTGTVTVNNVTVDDVHDGSGPAPVPGSEVLTNTSGLSSDAIANGSVDSLAPGDLATFTASYIVTQADVDAGVDITNIATANGTPTGGILSPPTDNEAVDVADPVPSMTLDKQITSATSYAAVGDVIDYSYLVTNDGNVSIDSVVVSDDKIDTLDISCPQTTLAPTESMTCTASYTIVQADLDTGTLTNNAQADGTPPTGSPPLVPPTDSETATATQTPTFTIDKTVVAGDPYAAVGDVITYSYAVSNTGNITLENLSVADDKVDVLGSVSCPQTTLPPAASMDCSASYTVTQADLNAGEVVNIATLSGDQTGGGALVPVMDTETVQADQDPAMTLNKQIASGSPFANENDSVSYTYDLTNSGNVSLSPAFAISDDVITTVNCPADAAAVGNNDANLDPGETIQCTATYNVTQADVDNGSVTNNASGTALDPDNNVVVSNEDQATAVSSPNPALAIDKVITSGSPFDTVGDTINYNFNVSNTGNVTLTSITVSDDQITTVSCPSPAADSLAPGATVVCTGSYTVEQADLNAGSVVNVALASAQDPGGVAVNSPTDDATATADQNELLTLVKAISGASTFSAVNDPIVFTYDLSNAGNTDLNAPFSVSDDKVAAVSCPADASGVGNGDAILNPGETIQCTGTYLVTQADLDAGSVTNIATATATAPSGPLDSLPDSETANATQTPVLSLVKAVDAADVPYPAAGALIDYTYDLTNNGNVTLSPPFNVSDDKISSVICPADASAVGNFDADLDVGETISCSGTYTVTQVDMDAGSITNIAAAAANDPSGNPITSADATVTVNADPNPLLSIDKSVTSGDPMLAAGDAVTYAYLVTNAGDVTINNITVSDDKVAPADLNCSSPAADSLAPGESVTCTGTYTVQLADMDADEVTNVASPNGVPTQGALPPPPTDTVTVDATPLPELAIVKSVTGGDPFSAVGDITSYSYDVTNNGNVTINAISVADDKVDVLGSVSCPVTPLIPGASLTCTASYAVTQVDLDAGSVTNIASPDGTPTQGALPAAPTDTATVPADPEPLLSIDKSLLNINGSPATTSISADGDVVAYQYVVTNNGNVTINNISVADDKVDVAGSVTCPATPLAPGDSHTCTASYTVTLADMDAGAVTNIASPDGDPVQGGLPPAPTDTITVPVDPQPSLTLVKSVDSGDPFAAVGDQISYSYAVTNDGNVTIANIAIDDDKIATVSCAANSLAPTESTSCTGIYTVTLDDLNAGEVINIATVNGDPSNGILTPPTDMQTVGATQTPELSIDKQITSGTPYSAVGESINYRYDLNNSGNVSLSPPFSVSDDVIDTVNCPADASGVGNGDANLDPGETITCTATHGVSQADLDQGSVVNTASGAAVDPNANIVRSGDDTEIAVADVNAGLAIDKELVSGSTYTAPGEVLSYSYTVSNIGNVTVNSVAVTDNNTDAAVVCLATILAPDESTTCTAQRTIAAGDIDAPGTVINTAFAQGLDPTGATATSPTDTETATADQMPALSLDKLFVGANTYSTAGEVISFTYEVVNAGNVSISNIALADDKIPAVSCPQSSLALGASMTCTGSYTITQDDIDNGTVTNIADVSGTPSGGGSLTATDEETASAVQDPVLSIDKSITAGTVFTTVNDVIDYQYVLTNDGNVSLSPPFAVADDKIPAGATCPAQAGGGADPIDLDVDESIVCTASYTVTQDDIDNSEVINLASASATDPNGQPVNSQTDTQTATADQTPALEMTKVDALDNSVIPPATATHPGDVINYTLVVENTGNVTITAVTIDDPNADAGSIACVPALPIVLAVGDIANCTAVHTVTQADIDTGEVENTATVSGTDPNNAPVTDESDDPDDATDADPDGDGEPDDPTNTPLTQFPELTLDKQIVSGDPFDAVGNTIQYSYLVSNTGTVTIDAIAVTDDKIDPVNCPLTTLAPGENMLCDGEYSVVQADLEAAEVTNIATANGTPRGGFLAPATDTETADADQLPAMTIDKMITAGDPFSMAGDIVQYSYLVVNTGNVSISALAVNDDKIASVTCGLSSLPAGAQTSCTGSYMVTQDDVDAGGVTNIATANGTPIGGNLVPPTDTETATANQDPAMSIDKTITTGDPYDELGQMVEYDYLVTNTGNVTIENLAIDDDKIASVTCTATELAPGASTNCLGVYIITQQDLDDGTLTNVAQATAATPGGDPVPPVEDTETATATQIVSLVLEKRLIGGSPFSAVGEQLSYEYLLTNDGNISLLAPFTINDDKIASVNCPADASGVGNGDGTLDRAETLTCTATYTIQQADLDAGGVVNIASAQATDPDGSTVISPTDTETAVANVNPGLSIDKEITSGSPFDGVGGADDVIRYSFEVQNIGNQTVNNVSVTDPLLGPGNVTCLLTTLAPMETTTCTGQYVILQADVNAGSINNTAFAVGQDPGGAAVNSPTDTETAVADQQPAITMDKRFDGDNTYSAVGDPINFIYEVSNVGNVDLTEVTLTDDKIPGVDASCAPVSLAAAGGALTVGQTTICTGTYNVTQQDIDDGSVTNIATSNATSPVGADPVPEVTDDETASAIQLAELEIEKTVDTNVLDPFHFNTVGGVVDYTYVVTNTGNVTINTLAVTDDKITTVSCDVATLAPTAQATCTGSYTVTQADLDATEVVNTASASAIDPNGDDVESGNAFATALAALEPNMSVTKRDTIVPAAPVAGDVIEYEITVTNNGNVKLSFVSIEDPLADAGSISCTPALAFEREVDPIPDLNPVICQATHTITQADLNAGFVENTATATGFDPDFNEVADDSDDPDEPADVNPDGDTDREGTADPDDPTVTPLTQLPAISLEKSGTFDDNNGDGLTQVGETISYVFEVFNIGNVDLTDVTISDPLVTVSGGPLASLAVGDSDSVTFTGSYTITLADINVGQFVNTATADASDPGGGMVSDTSDDPNDPTNTDDNMDGEPDDPTVTILPIQPFAVDDESLDNVPGTTVIVDTVGNDIGGSTPDPATVVIVGAPGDGKELVVPGEGVWNVDPVTGAIRFTPEATFNGDPTPINYTVEDALGNVSNPASVTITYLTTASINSRVWSDLDRDGLQDANEDGIANVVVELVDENGDPIDSDPATPGVQPTLTTTDLNGNYSFTGLEPGVIYQVSIPNPPTGLDHTFDLDDGTSSPNNLSGPIVLAPFEEFGDANFGYAPPVGSIGDRIWADTNGDGIQDPGELGIAGVTVTLFDGLGNVVDTAITDALGNYLFPGVGDGVHGIGVTPPAGYTVHDNGDPDVRDGVTQTADNLTTVTLEDGESNLDADFGYIPPAANEVSGTVFADGNGDGSNAGDEGIENVSVSLVLDVDGDGLFDPLIDTILTTVPTDSDGNYIFEDVPDGDYLVVVTDGDNLLDGLPQTGDPDAVLDSSTAISLAGADATGLDFGYQPPETDPAAIGVIGGSVFLDKDADDMNNGEGLEGTIVQLFDDAGILVATAMTDENGNYLFTGIPVGAGDTTYEVVVANMPIVGDPNTSSLVTNSFDPDGNVPHRSTVVLNTANPVQLAQDFAYEATTPNTIPGLLWADTNGDGIQDGDETERFAGVTVELRDTNGNIIQTTTTDANGEYAFAGLFDGDFTIVVTDEQNILAGTSHTQQGNGQGLSANTSKNDQGYLVSVSGGETLAPDVAIFGYEPTLTTPITLGFFSSELLAVGEIKFNWTTLSEIANAGFIIYQNVDDQWLAVNEDIIPAIGESQKPQAYEYIAYNIEGDRFVLVDVDVFGKQTLHGPFTLGESFGKARQPSNTQSSLRLRSATTDARDQQRQQQKLQRFKSALDDYLRRNQ